MVLKMPNEHSKYHNQMKLLKLTPLFIHQQFTITEDLKVKKYSQRQTSISECMFII